MSGSLSDGLLGQSGSGAQFRWNGSTGGAEDISQNLRWEKEVLGVYVSAHPFKSIAGKVQEFATHALIDLTPEIAGQVVTVAGMVKRATARATRDGRKFYVIDLEDLSGVAELTVWNDALELSGEDVWAEGQVVVAAVEVRDRGDRLSISVRKASAYQADEGAGTVVGFSPRQWESPPDQKPAPRKHAAAAPTSVPVTAQVSDDGEYSPVTVQVSGGRPPQQRRDSNVVPGPGQRSNGRSNSNGSNNYGRRDGPPRGDDRQRYSQPSPPPQQPVETARLVITLYESDDELTDRSVLQMVVALLKQHPGEDEVRLVIHDAEGQDTEFDFERVTLSEDLTRSLNRIVSVNKGQVVVQKVKVAAA